MRKIEISYRIFDENYLNSSILAIIPFPVNQSLGNINYIEIIAYQDKGNVTANSLYWVNNGVNYLCIEISGNKNTQLRATVNGVVVPHINITYPEKLKLINLLNKLTSGHRLDFAI